MKDKSNISVLKFGGTSVGNGERIRRVANIIALKLRDPGEGFPVVVVSAMSGVTDQLLRIAGAAQRGEKKESERELEVLKQKHLEAAKKSVSGVEHWRRLHQQLESAFTALELDIAAVENSRREGKDREAILDAASTIAAWGERLSVLLVAAAILDIGLQAIPISEELILTGPPEFEVAGALTSVTRADPLMEETRVNAQKIVFPLIARRIVPVVAGFIGRTLGGLVTTLGRNGSDYSATIIGGALDCAEVSIYSDVDGVLSADPRIIANTRLLPQLSYAEAARLSWFGARVLHPRTLIPVAHRNIPVRVRNTFRPDARGTLVGLESTQRSGAAAITVRRRLALITVENTDLFGASENAGQVFVLAARAGAAPVAICSSSGQHLSFVVDEQAADSVVSLLQHDMGNWRVHCRRELAACACIGSGFTADPMSPARAITALAHERIPIVTQGASESGIILIVEDRDSERALRCLHRDLIAPVIPLVRQNDSHIQVQGQSGMG